MGSNASRELDLGIQLGIFFVKSQLLIIFEYLTVENKTDFCQIV